MNHTDDPLLEILTLADYLRHHKDPAVSSMALRLEDICSRLKAQQSLPGQIPVSPGKGDMRHAGGNPFLLANLPSGHDIYEEGDMDPSALLEKLRAIRHKLIASEARYQSVLHATPDVIIITDMNHHIMMVSPSARRMFAIENDQDVVGIDILELIAPEDRERAGRVVTMRRDGTYTGIEEYLGIRRDNTLLYLETNGEVIRDARGNATGMVFIVRDVTERRIMENSLRRREQQYRLLADNVHDVIWTMDMEGNITYASPSVERLLGYRSRDLVNRTLNEILNPATARNTRAAFYSSLESLSEGMEDGVGRYEMELLRRDGTAVWVEAVISILHGGEGQSQTILGVLRDVSERKRADQAVLDQKILAEALRDTAEALNGTLNEVEVLDTMVETIGRVIPHEAMDILLVEGDALARVVRLRGFSEDRAKSLRNRTYPLHEVAAFEEMVRTRSFYFVEDGTGPGAIHMPVRGIMSYLACPLVAGGDVVGFMELVSSRKDVFSGIQGMRLNTFCTASSVALEKARLIEKLNHLATTDPLTGIYNRRHVLHLLEKEMERSWRYGLSMSLIALDIDYFKGVNDTYGHGTGDAVIRGVVERCRIPLRSVDVMGRIGGEEFIVILPETDLRGAIIVAERLRQEIASAPLFTPAGSVMITASFGVASLDVAEGVDVLLHRADVALYYAKEKGRNCVYDWSTASGMAEGIL